MSMCCASFSNNDGNIPSLVTGKIYLLMDSNLWTAPWPCFRFHIVLNNFLEIVHLEGAPSKLIISLRASVKNISNSFVHVIVSLDVV